MCPENALSLASQRPIQGIASDFIWRDLGRNVKLRRTFAGIAIPRKGKMLHSTRLVKRRRCGRDLTKGRALLLPQPTVNRTRGESASELPRIREALKLGGQRGGFTCHNSAPRTRTLPSQSSIKRGPWPCRGTTISTSHESQWRRSLSKSASAFGAVGVSLFVFLDQALPTEPVSTPLRQLPRRLPASDWPISFHRRRA